MRILYNLAEGVWGEWGRLFEHRPECRRQLGRPWVRKSPKVISGGPFQIPSNDGLWEAKVPSASPRRSVLLTLSVLRTEFFKFLQLWGGGDNLNISPNTEISPSFYLICWRVHNPWLGSAKLLRKFSILKRNSSFSRKILITQNKRWK